MVRVRMDVPASDYYARKPAQRAHAICENPGGQASLGNDRPLRDAAALAGCPCLPDPVSAARRAGTFRRVQRRQEYPNAPRARMAHDRGDWIRPHEAASAGGITGGVRKLYFCEDRDGERCASQADPAAPDDWWSPDDPPRPPGLRAGGLAGYWLFFVLYSSTFF